MNLETLSLANDLVSRLKKLEKSREELDTIMFRAKKQNEQDWEFYSYILDRSINITADMTVMEYWLKALDTEIKVIKDEIEKL